jgi:photosystem II stability/assembly factor-like uncharacterized protein
MASSASGVMLARLALAGVLAVVLPAAPVAAGAADEAVIAPLAQRSLLLDVVNAGDRLVAVGERGHVLISADAGASWHQSVVPTQANLTAVYFVDATHGWAVGHDDVILATSDGGRTWQRVNYAPEADKPLLDVWFADRTRGIAVGAYSTLYDSKDGGRTWTAAELAATPLVAAKAAPKRAVGLDDEAMSEDADVQEPHLNAIAAAANGTLYIAAEAGRLYRSTDHGESWVELPSPYSGSFFGVRPLAGDAVLAFGLRGHLFRSEDAGVTWRQLDSGTEAMLTGSAQLADGTLVVTGLAGVLLVSHDGGRTFVKTQRADRKGLAAVAAAGSDAIVVAGENGVRRLELGALDR